jgi:type II secretory pathway pseudopilin PulG
MRHGLKFRNSTTAKSRNRSRGYMMITMMLALTMITLALLVVLPDIRQQILRDREEEMQHRGTAYMRAIQHFYKKFGRYPNSVEELENTNNLRFLRKRYTDPLSVDKNTGKEKDFKLLHQQDISLNNGPVLGQPPGNGGSSALGGFGGAQQGGFGSSNSGLGGLGSQSGGSLTRGAQNSASADSSDPSSGNPSSGNPSSDGSASGNSSDAGQNSNSPGSSSSGSNSPSGLNGQTFGGGPVLGVASTSKAKSIRVFYDKNHYNDWLFVYIPQADRGGLLVGPINPGMPTGNVGGLTPGQMPGGTQQGQGGFGQGGPGQGGFGGSGFGQGGGQGLNGGQNPSPQTPPPPTAAPPQQ